MKQKAIIGETAEDCWKKVVWRGRDVGKMTSARILKLWSTMLLDGLHGCDDGGKC